YAQELSAIFGSRAVVQLKFAFTTWETIDVFNRERLIGLAACWHGAFAKFILQPNRFDAQEIELSMAGFQQVALLMKAERPFVEPTGLARLDYYVNRVECAIQYEGLILRGQEIGKVCAAMQEESDSHHAEELRLQALAMVGEALHQAEAM